jgi:hypothetical protein
MPFGIMDTSFIDWPANVDATYLQGLTLRSGLALTEVAGILDGALGRINAGVDPLLGSMLAPPTTSIFSRTGALSRMTVQRKSEYTMARPQQVARGAVSLPINEFEIALGWTEDGINEMSRDDVQMQVDALVEAYGRGDRAETLFRLFSDAEVPVDKGTAMTSPGLAGSGTGSNVFSGMYPDGTDLPGGYTHYYRDAAGNLLALITAMRDRLRKWHEPPFELVGSQSIVDQIVALGTPGFVSAGSALIRPADNVSLAQVDPANYVGVVANDVRVQRAIMDFSTDHFAIFKSYGSFNTRNPLVWRYDERRGLNAIARSRTLFPLAEVTAIRKYGVGTNNRVGAAVAYVAGSGGYVPPTFAY